MSAGPDPVETRVPALDPCKLDPRVDAPDLGEAARTALLNAYRPGDDWTDMFDRLTPSEVEGLTALFPFMPSHAARHFAERFIIPTR